MGNKWEDGVRRIEAEQGKEQRREEEQRTRIRQQARETTRRAEERRQQQAERALQSTRKISFTELDKHGIHDLLEDVRANAWKAGTVRKTDNIFEHKDHTQIPPVTFPGYSLEMPGIFKKPFYTTEHHWNMDGQEWNETIYGGKFDEPGVTSLSIGTVIRSDNVLFLVRSYIPWGSLASFDDYEQLLAQKYMGSSLNLIPVSNLIRFLRRPTGKAAVRRDLEQVIMTDLAKRKQQKVAPFQ